MPKLPFASADHTAHSGARVSALLSPLISLALLIAPARSNAQSYARFEVPDSSMVAVVAADRADFEAHWNTLFVNTLRASMSRADSAARLAALSRRVATAEPAALGSRLALDALALSTHWSEAQRRQRVSAAVSESLATAARAAREFDTAAAHYSTALAGYRAVSERRREAWVVGGMAASALLAHQFARAESLYRESLGLRRRLGDPRMIGNTLNDLGQVYYQLGRMEEAHQYLGEAYAVRSGSGQHAALWNTFSYLGLTLVALGKPDSAERCFDAALEITTAQGDSGRTEDVLSHLVTLLSDQDDPRAQPVGDRAIAIARELEDPVRESGLWHNLGDYLSRNGRYTEAMEHFRHAARLRHDDPANLASSLNSLGATCLVVGDPERARSYLDRALALADSIDNRSLRSSVLVSQAMVLDELGDPTGATRRAERAIEEAVAEGDSGRVRDACAALGELSAASGDLELEQRWRERALNAGLHLDPERHAADITNLALVWHHQGRLDQAERGYREAIALARATGSIEVAVWSMTDLGDVAERRADFPAALARYGEAAALIDSARRMQGERESIKLFARGVFVREAMIHLLGKLDRIHPDSGYAERAYALAERSRGRSLLDRLAASSGRSGENTVTLTGAQRLIGTDREALLEYSVGDSSTSLWVIRRREWNYLRLPGRDALRSRIQTLRLGLADPVAARSPATRAAEQKLYRTLFAPAEPFLRGVDRVTIVPDGILSLIPFEALLAGDSAGDPDPREYLIHRYAVSYAPSVSALLAHRAAPAEGAIVALGNPRFEIAAGSSRSRADSAGVTASADESSDSLDEANLATPALAALPSTETEVENLRALAGGREVRTLLGGEATRGRLLAALPGAEIIHLATHGDVNEAEPERSGLWLAASDSSGPRRLEARDILGLKLDAALVTLSACETGLGRLERGEGVVGLARAFLASGARSVIVSLWQVNDRSTAELMSRFYRAALRGNHDRASALADSKRALLARPETSSPFYWAPFVLIGEAGPLR